MRLSIAALALLLPSAVHAQLVTTMGLGYGAQSSYQHPTFVSADAGFQIGRGWLLAPAARMAWNEGMTGIRVQVSFQRRLAAGSVRPYLGLGPSWTNEVGEQQWNSGEYGAMGLVGLEARVSPRLWLYGQLDGYTHHYATGQAHLGLRFHR